MEIEVLDRMIFFVMPLAYIGKFTVSSLATGSGIELISMLLLRGIIILATFNHKSLSIFKKGYF
jgi:hypothetical protein